jgi:hypothetical protein
LFPPDIPVSFRPAHSNTKIKKAKKGLDKAKPLPTDLQQFESLKGNRAANQGAGAKNFVFVKPKIDQITDSFHVRSPSPSCQQRNHWPRGFDSISKNVSVTKIEQHQGKSDSGPQTIARWPSGALWRPFYPNFISTGRKDSCPSSAMLGPPY